MKKSSFLIDGFNFYHSINSPGNFKYKWLDYNKLAHVLKYPDEQVDSVYLFTAFAQWDPNKKARHKLLIRALDSVGVKTVFGQFKDKHIKCKLCKGVFKRPIEKQTDINIASKLFELSIKNGHDKIYVVTGDSDLAPAIKTASGLFSNLEFISVLPFGQKTRLLKQVCDAQIKIKKKHLDSCRFPNVVTLPDGQSITCPSEWH